MNAEIFRAVRSRHAAAVEITVHTTPVSRRASIQGAGNHMRSDTDNDKQVCSDIKQFVSTRVEELSSIVGFSNDFRQAVEDKLLERATGTFLWVGFAMTELFRKRQDQPVRMRHARTTSLVYLNGTRPNRSKSPSLGGRN